MESNSCLSQRQLIKNLVQENKYSAAYDLLLQLLTQSPNDYIFLSQIGYVSYLMQSYSESLGYYKQCIDINETQIVNSFVSNWFSYHQYAKLLHFHLRNYISAKAYYIKSLKLNNYNIPIYHDIAKLYLATGNYAESQTYFEQYFTSINHRNYAKSKRIHKLRENIDIIHYEYAQLLFYKLDRKNNGKSHMQIAIDLKPHNDAYQFEFAIMLKRSQSLKKAKKSFIKCIELTRSKNDRYLYEYGLFLTDSIKDTKNGMLYVKKAYDLAPSNVQYKNEYIALKNWNQYQLQSTIKPNKKCYAQIINTKKPINAAPKNNQQREIYNSIKRDARRIKFEDGSNSDCVQSIDWDKICGTNNKYTSRILEFKSKFKIACQAQAEHNYVLAKNILEDLIKIAPEDGEIFGRYAFALAQLNILPKAEKYYKKSLMLSPRNYVTMYNYAFLLYYKLKRYHKAECLYKKCLKIKPNCAKALLNYARLLDTIKEKKRSEQYYRMCLSGSPNYDLCFYYFGCFLYRQERYEEAKYFLQKAVDCWPHSHLHHFRLAVTCHILCEYDKCEHHLQEALRIKPNFEAAMEAFERYGYGQIHKNGKNGRLVFTHYNCNSKSNAHNTDDGYYNHYNYKNTNRFGKYYVKKTGNRTGTSHTDVTTANGDDGDDVMINQGEGANNGDRSDDTSNPGTAETDLEEEHSPESCNANAVSKQHQLQQHLRMYDPIRRNHRFNIDEKWVDDSREIKHFSDDKKYFINWLKSIRLYEEVRGVFSSNGIATMKKFHAQISSKRLLIAMFRNKLNAGNEEMMDIIWDSAPKQMNHKKKSSYWIS